MLPIKDGEFRSWLLDIVGDAPDDDSVLSVYGSSPFTEDELIDLLHHGNMDVYRIHDETELLIIGRDGWDESELDKLLDDREAQNLKVYSQEMFLTRWITGHDPFDDEDVAFAFVTGHPALEYLTGKWVDWVSTTVSLNSGNSELEIESPKTSVLKELGYTVGKTKGKPTIERHQILRRAFTSELREVLSSEYFDYCQENFPDYLAEWGNPQSERRLIKMRDYLATLCKRQKRRGNIEAATDYQGDLDWIEANIHTGRFKFDWLNYQID